MTRVKIQANVDLNPERFSSDVLGLPGFGLEAAFSLGMITKLPQGICGWLERQQQMEDVEI
jgi:hypothetical protein